MTTRRQADWGLLPYANLHLGSNYSHDAFLCLRKNDVWLPELALNESENTEALWEQGLWQPLVMEKRQCSRPQRAKYGSVGKPLSLALCLNVV